MARINWIYFVAGALFGVLMTLLSGLPYVHHLADRAIAAHEKAQPTPTPAPSR